MRAFWLPGLLCLVSATTPLRGQDAPTRLDLVTREVRAAAGGYLPAGSDAEQRAGWWKGPCDS